MKRQKETAADAARRIELMKQYAEQGYTARETAQKLGLSVDDVERRAVRWGIAFAK